mmetsp:Transcript_25739/g.38944  ORF Transcript_25739/g.38944 Transcript_25739/m.38944 type:complete len:512 (+) Transcript_25739:111-1646(+)
MAFIPSAPTVVDCTLPSGAYKQLPLPSRRVSSHRCPHPIVKNPLRIPSHLSSSISVPDAAAASAAVIKQASGRHSFHLVIAFLLGGIFFSATLSVINAFARFGRENIIRGWNLFKIVWGRVWTIYTYGLSTAWGTLVEGKRFRPQFRAFWRELKEQLTLTREAAVEGFEAIKLEASLYTAVIGPTNMVLAQYALDNLTPKLLANIAKVNLMKAISEIRNNNVKKIELESFKFGSEGPKLVSGRIYDLRKNDAMAVDFDVKWDSESEVGIRVTPKLLGVNKSKSRVTIPVTIKNFKFDGVVRVIMTPLTDSPPGFGAVLISFPKSPVISLDCTLSKVEITKTPWLKTELLKEIQKSVSNQFLWPRRIVLPSAVVPEPIRPFLSHLELDKLTTSDPLLKAQKIIDSNELVVKNNLIRDLPDEDEMLENMDIFVGDENERLKLGKEENATISNNNMGGLRFPWQRVDNDHLSNQRRFPWQNNATSTGGEIRRNTFRFPWQRLDNLKAEPVPKED